MSRVSENSNSHALNYSIGKAKAKLEDLQLKGSNLKNIQKPSDDPLGSTEVLTFRSRKADSEQYYRNSLVAKTQLEYTENALNDLNDVLLRAKEITIAQSSEVFGEDARKSIAEEAKQLYLQALAIANKKLGNRYIFSGNKTLTKPFDENGTYQGDKGKIFLEVAKDYFIPINVSGHEIAQTSDKGNNQGIKLGEYEPDINTDPNARSVASAKASTNTTIENNNSEKLQDSDAQHPVGEIFADLKTLYNALSTNNPKIIQGLLEKFDQHMDQAVKLRTKIGSLTSALDNVANHNERDLILQQAQLSKIEDADVTDLFTDIQKNQATLEATYKTGATMLNKNLLNFIG